uniref:Reverse transcriptase/retrotransposon-derived protein RNase H-like domain-containing protein n=1 Tax=Oncorhynchus tshawytscha TaxID=74940 RepID=A0AAZ3NNW3_ONCTS
MQTGQAKAKHKKLQFKVPEVRFHGHILSSTGLKADPEKVKAVLEMPHPSDVKGVQRFVGFVTYLAKFLPRLSEVCEPLRRLMDKDTIWHWLPKHDAAVREIKQLVTQTPVLRYYNVSKPVTIQSDSSQYGLGCCLMQEGQPVAFVSRALTPTEQNYAQIEGVPQHCVCMQTLPPLTVRARQYYRRDRSQAPYCYILQASSECPKTTVEHATGPTKLQPRGGV